MEQSHIERRGIDVATLSLQIIANLLKYAKENLKRVPLDLQKSTYEEIKTHAESRKESVNGRAGHEGRPNQKPEAPD